jgi:hypothetical protein
MWQLNSGAAAMPTRYGPGVSIPIDNGAEIEALAGSNPSFAAWEQNESYTIALLIKGRSGGASTKHLYRSGSSSTADHILFLTIVRRWHADPFGFLRPGNELPALIGSPPPATPPSTGTGVVTFLMW